MFRKDEASRINQEFWTIFGKYMKPILSAGGLRINWVNYHTGLKDVYFRMTTGKSPAIFISMEHRDASIQELYFEQFSELQHVLNTHLQEEWEWRLMEPVEGKVISRIIKETSTLSVYNKEHWPELISFFKPRIIALDNFWEDAKWSFDGLK